jgi:hypothetical protein
MGFVPIGFVCEPVSTCVAFNVKTPHFAAMKHLYRIKALDILKLFLASFHVIFCNLLIFQFYFDVFTAEAQGSPRDAGNQIRACRPVQQSPYF